MMSRIAITAAMVALVTTVTTPLPGEADTVLAICEAGGCTCSLSPLSAQEIMDIAGATVEADASVDPTRETLVWEPDLGVLSWVDAPRRDIQAHFGGIGDCPVTQFPAPETIAPLDGRWQWRTLGESTSGCPALLGGMLAASRVEYMTTQVDWGGAFDPRRLADILPQPDVAGLSPYEWRELGSYRWRSDNVQSRNCDDGSCGEIAVTQNMILVAPDRVSGILSLRSSMDSPQAAIMAGFGMQECRVRLRYDILRVAP